MHNSDYYTHNESLLSNVFPFIKVFIYVDWKDLSNIYTEQVLFIKLNVDENSITPSKYGISSIPTFLIIKDSQVMESIIGAVDQEMFENKINKYL